MFACQANSKSDAFPSPHGSGTSSTHARLKSVISILPTEYAFLAASFCGEWTSANDSQRDEKISWLTFGADIIFPWRGTQLKVLTRVKASPCGAFIGPQPNNNDNKLLTTTPPLSLSLSILPDVWEGFSAEFPFKFDDLRLSFSHFSVVTREMGEDIRHNNPSLSPDLEATGGCGCELTRTNSDSSSITADNSKEAPPRCGNAGPVIFGLLLLFVS